jgi:low affinity Fe/Cu permease
VSERFSRFSTGAATVVGSYWAFIVALGLVFAWALSGPVFGFSDTWQLAINTSTTIVTFLMVFLLQYDQNRNAKAIQVKLDELIRSGEGARNKLVDAEDLSDEQLEDLHAEFQRLRSARRKSRRRGRRAGTASRKRVRASNGRH